MSGLATFTVRRLEVGALNRKHVRAWVNELRVSGMDVELHETEFLLESVFSLRASGTDDQVRAAADGFSRLESALLARAAR